MLIFWNVCSYKREQCGDRKVEITLSLGIGGAYVWAKLPTEGSHCQFLC